LITVIFPQKQQNIFNVALAQDVSKQAISELITRQLSLDPVHPEGSVKGPREVRAIRPIHAKSTFEGW
jgi:hypothetical protein